MKAIIEMQFAQRAERMVRFIKCIDTYVLQKRNTGFGFLCF